MRHYTRRLAVITFFCVVPYLATTQNNRISFWSAGNSENGTISMECAQQARIFMNSAQYFPEPSNWRFVIVCDEFTWNRFTRESGQFQPRVQVYAATNLDRRTTFIRGWHLTHVDLTMGAPTPERVVAHELAHIILNTLDDDLADRQAIAWLEAADLPVLPFFEKPTPPSP